MLSVCERSGFLRIDFISCVSLVINFRSYVNVKLIIVKTIFPFIYFCQFLFHFLSAEINICYSIYCHFYIPIILKHLDRFWNC